MLENVYEIIDFQMIKFKKAKKTTYEQRMEEFRQNHGHYIDEMLKFIADAEDKEAAAVEISKIFTDNVYDHFAWHGKVRGIANSDSTLFMIFYVFPAIQLTEDENAILLCDKLRDYWSERYGNPGMGYTTYADLHDGFREKIFGIF